MKKKQKNSITPLIQLGILEKFTLSISFLVMSLVIIRDMFAFILMLCLLSFLLFYNIKLKEILRFLRIPLIFAFFGLLSIILVLGTNENDAFWVISSKYIPLSITNESLAEGKTVLWRVLNSLFSLYILIATTSPIEKNTIAEKLHIPKSLIELGVLSFRYIQILEKKKREIMTSQRLRLGYSSYRKSFNSLALLLSTIFIYSITAFRTNYQALICRGYNGSLYHSPDITNLPKDRWWVLLTFTILTIFILVFYQIHS